MNILGVKSSVKDSAISQLRSDEAPSNKENLDPQPQKIEANYTASKQTNSEEGDLNSLRSFGEERNSLINLQVEQEERLKFQQDYEDFKKELDEVGSSVSQSPAEKVYPDVIEKVN